MKTEWQINLENANTGAFARWARKHQREYDMDEKERQAHVLGIGDKASQRRDIGAAKKAIGRMK